METYVPAPCCSELNRTLALSGDILGLVPFDPGTDKMWRGVDKREVGASKRSRGGSYMPRTLGIGQKAR